MDKAAARRRHDALIRKANSSTFPAEAEACRAKAAELYETHALRPRREYSTPAYGGLAHDQVVVDEPMTEDQWDQWFKSHVTTTTTGSFGGVTIRIIRTRR